VVAEGVEHEHQFESLRAEGCDEFQGYYCRPPLEEAELMEFLAEERANRAPLGFRPSLST
jgi:EAL domain-containing protein (putative c-di-GMP-specific phosphodiesterase class I)